MIRDYQIRSGPSGDGSTPVSEARVEYFWRCVDTLSPVSRALTSLPFQSRAAEPKADTKESEAAPP